jgi:uroporphyrinogen decarboxylase
MLTRRERVLRAITFQATDQLPKDLGAMASTGISCFAYPKLVDALGLPPRLPRVFDTGQMLALPDLDVLDALDCDCITVQGTSSTNAFEEPERWHPYDFGGRLPALVMNPEAYTVEPNGTVVQGGNARMVPDSYVFDTPHAGEMLNLDGDIPMEDLTALEAHLAAHRYTDEQVQATAAYCRRAREATDRAIMFSGLSAGLCLRGGMANFSILCLTEPDYVHALHDLLTRHAIAQIERMLPAIAPYVDILMFSADDQGIQSGSILPPAVFGALFAPYYRRANHTVHRVAPDVKTFLHSCGAIYGLLDDVIAAEFDILNPVQWSAGGQGYQAWKDRCRGRICLWGGGVNTQTTLPFGTLADVEREVHEVVRYLRQDSGFVFCAIHNLLAEVEPEKVLALYRMAKLTPAPAL